MLVILWVNRFVTFLISYASNYLAVDQSCLFRLYKILVFYVTVFIRQKSGGHLHKPMEPIVKTPHGNSSQAKKLKMEEQQRQQASHHQLGLGLLQQHDLNPHY